MHLLGLGTVSLVQCLARALGDDRVLDVVGGPVVVGGDVVVHLGAFLLGRHDELGFDLSVGRTGIGSETRRRVLLDGSSKGSIVEHVWHGKVEDYMKDGV